MDKLDNKNPIEEVKEEEGYSVNYMRHELDWLKKNYKPEPKFVQDLRRKIDKVINNNE